MRFSRLLLAVITLSSFAAVAQKKEFNYTELLQNKLPKNFINPMPTVVRWVDDEHVILNRRVHPDSAARNYIHDVKTGSFTEIAGSTPGSGRGAGQGAPPATGKAIGAAIIRR